MGKHPESSRKKKEAGQSSLRSPIVSAFTSLRCRPYLGGDEGSEPYGLFGGVAQAVRPHMSVILRVPDPHMPRHGTLYKSSVVIGHLIVFICKPDISRQLAVFDTRGLIKILTEYTLQDSNGHVTPDDSLFHESEAETRLFPRRPQFRVFPAQAFRGMTIFRHGRGLTSAHAHCQ